jgi:hypothetical protein
MFEFNERRLIGISLQLFSWGGGRKIYINTDKRKNYTKYQSKNEKYLK